MREGPMANTSEAPRCAALIGPYLSGKTTLLEALLHASGSTSRRGSVRDGNSVGDHSPEARARQMSTELNVAGASFLGDRWTILDCPGSVELLHEAQGALLVSDVAVVVVEPEVERALTISALLRFLDRHKIPHMIFINKMDNASARVRDLLAALQSVSERPLVLRQVPLRGPEGETLAQVFKTYHLPHTGKLSLARVWRGTISEGMVLNGSRVAGVLRLVGAQQEKVPAAQAGEVVGLTRMEDIATGTVLTPSGKAAPLPQPERPQPVYGLAITSERRTDDVKLTGAIGKLVEEDPTLELEQNADTQEMVLWGQGDIHLQIAIDRLRTRHNLAVNGRRAGVPYKETIRQGAQQHSRFKRQSGGHGQFADVTIEVKPLPRGSGFTYTNSVVGGAIPRNYIPAVEEGVIEALLHGPIGFPVVDVAVNLITGQFHAVDSSDQAFKTAGRQAVQEALPKCEPILLEPIDMVEISVPNAFTARVQRLVSGRRGQILGYDAKPDWPGWDVVSAHLPQSELHDLIVELRSLTMGVGSFAHQFDHMQELSGRPAEKVLASRTADAAQ